MSAEYGDATHWMGDDDRDTLTQIDHDCASCGARWNEVCEKGCLCTFCVQMRARTAAAEFDALCPKGDAA